MTIPQGQVLNRPLCSAKRYAKQSWQSRRDAYGIENRGDCPNFEPSEAVRRGQQLASSLPPHTPLFTVPTALVKILDRDLKLAGIPKKDGRGWTIDVHAMRHTFGTLLSRSNVAPRTAQAAMRHSSIDLTMNVYTDPKLLDVAGALEALPELSLAATSSANLPCLRATGTEDANANR